MDLFSDSLARLKHQLRVSKDREVADALGLSPTAFSERKKRGSFPQRELVALAQSKPELGLDVTYILTGETQRDRAANLAAGPRASAVEAVLDLHRGKEASAPPAPSRDELARGTRTDPDWPLVMEWVYDALNARKLRMPNGKKLRELVDAVLVLLRLEEGELDREKTRRKIDALL